MFDITPAAILEIIKQGESETVEFKSSLPPDKVVARDLTAFANTKGGIMLIGVDDNGEILGLADTEIERTLTRLNRVSSSLCDWSISTGAVAITNKKIVFIVINKAPEHLSPVMVSTGQIFARKGAEDVQLTESESLELVKKNRPANKEVYTPHPDTPCIVFVAMSFREEQEPALVDYYQAMERAVESTGLLIVLQRMDLVEGDYEISQEIMNKIGEADVVITDFTLNSPNVYFELGYARGRGKRIIQTARKDTDLEFDVRSWRTLIYRNATELEQKITLELVAAHQAFTEDLMRTAPTQ